MRPTVKMTGVQREGCLSVLETMWLHLKKRNMFSIHSSGNDSDGDGNGNAPTS